MLLLLLIIFLIFICRNKGNVCKCLCMIFFVNVWLVILIVICIYYIFYYIVCIICEEYIVNVDIKSFVFVENIVIIMMVLF